MKFFLIFSGNALKRLFIAFIEKVDILQSIFLILVNRLSMLLKENIQKVPSFSSDWDWEKGRGGGIKKRWTDYFKEQGFRGRLLERGDKKRVSDKKDRLR